MRFNVIGTGVHALHLAQARDLVIARARAARAPGAGAAARGYVCCCDVNNLSCARRDARHRAILNAAFLATPDGMPVVWMGRWAGHAGVGRVYGPDLLEAVAAATSGATPDEDLTHFFYGAGPGTAELLARKLVTRFPGLRVAGVHTPPFGAPESDAAHVAALEAEVRAARPDFFWVGLSTPKQERCMAALLPRLDVGVMLGVGAAFDLLSGRVRQAPRWAQRSALEWAWRLVLEPWRLGPRYLRNNPLFVLRVAGQLAGMKRFRLETPGG